MNKSRPVPGFAGKWAWPLLLLALVSGQVFAANYTFPGSLPAGCSGSGPAYTCGTLSLAWDDRITINAPKPATITINGNFSTNTNTINGGGSAADLTVIVNGEATISYGTVFTGNLTTRGASGNVSIGGTVNGPLTATGNVELTSNLSRITGNVDSAKKVTVADGARIDGTTTAASVESKSACIFGGAITATTGTIVLGSGTTVAGDVVANGATGGVTHGGGKITGSMTTTGNVSFTVNGARVTGNVTAGGRATLAYGGRIDGTTVATAVSDVGGCTYGGNVTATTGAVSLGYDSKVTGNVIAQANSGGTITVGGSGTRPQVSGCVATNSTAAGSIKFTNWGSSAGGVCCNSGGSCLPVSNACYTNSSNPAYPLSTAVCAGVLPAPAPVLVAEYRLDEGAWTSAAGSLKDTSGNGLNGSTLNGATVSGASGKLCKSASFAPVGAQLNGMIASDNAKLDVQKITMMAWVYPTNYGGWDYIVKKYGAYKMVMNSSGALVIEIGYGSNDNTYRETATNIILPKNQWSLVAATYDGRYTKSYVYAAGGTLLASHSQDWGSEILIRNSINGFQIGPYWGWAPSDQYDGQIDEVKVFDGALSNSQIDAIAASEAAGKNWDGSTRTCPGQNVKVGSCAVSGVTETYTTIQAAVNAAVDGGTVWICSGTYAENVNIANKVLTLKSATGNKADVTISPSATAAIASNAALTVQNLSIASANAGVNGINACPASPATLTLSSVDINVANSQYGDNYAIFQNTSGNGCQGLTLNLSNVIANSPRRGYGIRVNNGAGAHVLNTVSATGGDHGWDNYGALWISGGSSFTATNLDVTYNGGYSTRGANAALWLTGIAGNIGITANDGKAHAIKTTAGGNYGIYVCPSAPATFTLAGASNTALTTVSTTTTVGWTSGTAIFQGTSSSCSATTFNLSNLTVSSQGADGGIKINNGGGNHQFNYLTIANGFILTNGSGATFTDVDMSSTQDNAYGYIATLSNLSGAVAFTTAQKSQVGYSNVTGRMGGIYVAAAAGSTIPLTLANVNVDVTEYGVATGNGSIWGKHTLNAANVTAGSRASGGIYLLNGAGNHIVNKATLYGKNGYGWPLRIDGGADITLTDVDATQLGTSASGYPAVSLNAFTGNLTVNAATKTGNRCTGNFNASGTGTANSTPGACIMNLDTAGGTVSTNQTAYGLSVCNAAAATSQVTISGLYAQGSANGIGLTGGGSCGKYTANLSNVTAEVTSAYFKPTTANPDTLNNHGWARPISIGNGTGTHQLTKVTAIGTYAYNGISIGGGGATLTDVYATGLSAAVNLGAMNGPVTISNPVWAAANPYPATNPATFPIRGVSWPNGINGSGLDVALGTTSATTVTLQNTAIGGAGAGMWLNYNSYSYPNLKLVMSNVSVDAAKGDGVRLWYGNGQAHSIANVTATATGNAMVLSRGANAALSGLNLTCGNDGTTAGTGLYLNYQSGTTLSGVNTVTCKSPNSTGIALGGDDGGCVSCSVSGATIDMQGKSGSTGIYSRNGDATARTITGNTIKNAPSYGINVGDYPDTVTNNIIENSGGTNYGINMSRGAGAAYNNCVYSPSGHVITSQTSLCAGASPCNSSYPLVDPKPSASATKQGNFWGSWPKGTGFSDTCADANSDGLCDSATGGDNAPLKKCLLSADTSATLVAHYKFDDTWSGTDALDDSSGNNKQATLSGTVAQESAPASGGKPITCKAGNFNKAGYFTTASGLDIDTAADKKNSVTFWMYWDGGFSSSNFTMPFSWGGVYYDLAVSKYRAEMGNGVIGFNTGNGDIFGVTADGLANGWHHVAAVFNNGDATKNKLYIDGVAKTLTSYGGQATRSATASAGIGAGAAWGSEYQWSGKLDNVKIYKGEVDAAQIAADMAEVTLCVPEPLAEYRMDETSWSGAAGEVANSISTAGSYPAGKAVGGASTTAGKLCSAGSFSGSGQSVQVDTAVSLADFTYSAWVNDNGSSGFRSIVDVDNDRQLLAKNGSSYTIYGRCGNIPITTGSAGWHHLAWTVAGANYTVYVDGVAVKSGAGCGTALSGGTHLMIGAGYPGNEYWNGQIDEVKVWNSSLTATQVQTVYNNESTGKNWDGTARSCPATPIAEWRMDETSWNGTTGEVKDSSGNNRTGVAQNGATTTSAGKVCGGGDFTRVATDMNSINRDHVNVANSTIDNLTAAVTVMGWVKPVGTVTQPWGAIAYDYVFSNTRDVVDPNGTTYKGFGLGVVGGSQPNSRFEIWGGDNAKHSAYSSTVALGNWVHLAGTYDGQNVKLYVDGVLVATTPYVGSIAAPASASGTIGRMGTCRQCEANALIDEVKVFDRALTAAQIAAGYANETAGKNWDGTARSCPAALVAEWRMDEASWNGTAGEVKDSKASYHGTAQSGATTANGKLCRAGDFDGTAARSATLAAGFQDAAVNNFAMAFWVKPGKTHEIDTESNSGTAGWDANANYALFPAFDAKGKSWCDSSINRAAAGVSVGTNGITVYEHKCSYLPAVLVWSGAVSNTEWTHVVVAYRAGIPSLFVNGAFVKTGVKGAQVEVVPTNVVGASNSYVGGYQGGVDEYMVFSGQMTEGEISQIYANEVAGKNWDGTARTCPLYGPDHIRIEHDGSALTCIREPVTIKACARADDNCATLYASDVTLSLAPAAGWYATASGGSESNALTIIGSGSGGGAATRYLQKATAGTVTLGATGIAPIPTNPVVKCLVGATENCSLVFAEAGFVFDVPHHVADTPQTIAVSAVKKAATGQSCAPAFVNVDKTLNFNCGFGNPASGSLPVAVGGSNIVCGTGGNVTLNFNASGVASTTVRYADVGQMSLTASYAGSGSEAGLSMTGSDNFIAAPRDFAIAPTGPYVAGTNFGATVTARNNSGAATPNFGRESTAESATLSFTRCQPTGAGTSPGSYSGALGSFSSGAASASNLVWTEVGNGDLAATLTSGNYLGSGVTAAAGNTGSGGTVCNGAGNVGSFGPHHFDIEVTAHGCGSFTYSGQPFTVQVTAKNGLATPDTTVNYDGRATTSPVFARTVTLSDTNGAAGSWTNGSLTAGSFTSGVASGTPTFTFTATPAGQATLRLRAVDTAGVASVAGLKDTTILRSGRLRLLNAYGSVSPLSMPVETQYWSGSTWVRNPDDSCTTTGTSAVTFAAAPASGWTLTPNAFAAGTMSGGLGIGKAGSVTDPSTTITATVPDWLKWSWGVATTNINPSATATVGVYGTRESRRAVHIRELY